MTRSPTSLRARRRARAHLKSAAVEPLKVGTIVRAIEARTPSGTAASWDNVGLLLGDPDATTRGAVVSIDLTRESIDECLRRGWKLIVNHHPCIFPRGKGPSRVTKGSLVYEALTQGISVVATHTNFDQCALEVVEAVSKALGASPRGRLHDPQDEGMRKLVVFVPQTHLAGVREAVTAAGAGHVGNYDSCTFASPGEGTFRGGKGTRPFLGQAGQLEHVDEVRLETVFPVGCQQEVLAALRMAHPYEEIAYDLISLLQKPSSSGLVRGLGYGFWGDFEKPIPWRELEKRILRAFGISGFWLTEPAPQKVRRIGYVAGKGASFVGSARAQGCDVFITGEAGYHVALDAARGGMAVAELGHRESERFFLSVVTAWLGELGLEAMELNRPTQAIRC